MTLEEKKRLKKPCIAIHEKDFASLARLAELATKSMPDVGGYLEQELERARIVSGRSASTRIVGMGSKVEYRDEATGKIHVVTLVYPADSDIEQGLVSVLTPIGAALIGLSQGQSIHWNTRSGECRRLSVISVSNETGSGPAVALGDATAGSAEQEVR
jgi:regulator of nucleoside diphosphate kinase